MTRSEFRESLVRAALDAREAAYAPYSNFAVGAALADADGVIHVGSNVENASYGLTVCAERVAIWSAVAKGVRSMETMAIATDGGLAPCGACRQVMAEFAEDLELLLVDSQQANRVVTVSLPAKEGVEVPTEADLQAVFDRVDIDGVGYRGVVDPVDANRHGCFGGAGLAVRVDRLIGEYHVFKRGRGQVLKSTSGRGSNTNRPSLRNVD